MFHVEHDYKINHLKFKKALAQRNRALKKSSSSELKTWTRIFIDLSQKLTRNRLNFIDSFLKECGYFNINDVKKRSNYFYSNFKTELK